ncbi:MULTISPECIES: hypothetical protein [Actibacterium]|jgi:hypothetical protein|uniref:Uncharacterized protein n=1 Tax=Actibacterium naphthalenivorans TaxID=1614693 RepID=A0A840CLS3_9RHOB|nr:MULTISPECIES: hypothetical protein [Actibacterium]MBB4024099.1 hypothetical protein [Actibacterium naphthalenivorans]
MNGSTDGYAGRIEVFEGWSGRRMWSEAERPRNEVQQDRMVVDGPRPGPGGTP